jgi:predicted MFS family arabinose efflux permease
VSTSGVRNYAVVTGAYWAFTLTDGALRMLVLLHFHALGYSPLSLALLFVLYEVLGVVTNLFGGFIAARSGLKKTLISGLVLQVVALVTLGGLRDAWPVGQQVVYVLFAQGLSGVAKDLTKLSAKSAIKAVIPENENGALFRWVALLTGSKNALKGVGFFLGGGLLSLLGFRGALLCLAAGVLVSAICAGALLPGELGRAKKKPTLSGLLSKTRAINLLSLARMFLFCARDVWFVVALPVFLYEVLGFTFVQVGSYMALWVIGYGAVQSLTPKLLRHGPNENEARAAQLWAFGLLLVPLLIAGGLTANASPSIVVLGGLAAFGAVFAVNSSLHSYLVLSYADADKVAENVGFYYMANAAGRLLGTLLSGLLYQLGGLRLCLLAAAGLVLLSALSCLGLPDTRRMRQATTP